MTLTDPPEPVVSHGLSPDQCVTFANIILTWGAAEDELGAALLFLYEIHEGWIANHLVVPLSGRKKAELVLKAFDHLNQGSEAIPILKKVRKVQTEWADDRNVLYQSA